MTMHRNVVPPAPSAVAGPAETFRQAMRQFAGGVAIVTAGTGADRTGLTATAITSLSAEPSALVVCVNRSASAWPLILREQAFGVNLLAVGHVGLAKRFAGVDGVKGAARYEQGLWTRLETGVPVLADALAAFDCAVEEVFERHSHAVLIGRVRAVHAGLPGDPLLYWQGGYRSLAGSGDDWSPVVERLAAR
ncbi:MAG TPA: flavin reductase family protein [Xanthobacteraceae bacterium]|nr:flavin reductase family protein [Xanthobacteraceae bacterium]